MSSKGGAEDLLPNIGELPGDIQQHLRNFAQIAKNAVEKRDEALRRLQGLGNLSRILQEYQAENVRNQDQFKWYEIVLLRTEADLLRTKKKLQVKEAANEQLHQKFERMRVKGQIPKEEEDLSGVRDQSDGKTDADETDRKPPSSIGPSRSRPKCTLATVFVGISEDIHNKTLQELEETRRQLKEKIQEDNVTYKEYLDATKSEMQIRKLQETLQEKNKTIEKQKKELEEITMMDRDKVITDLKKENERHRESDAMKVKVIEASNRRCQELKEEIEKLRQQYTHLRESQERGRRVDPFAGDAVNGAAKGSLQKLHEDNELLQIMVQELKSREEQLMLENGRVRTERECLRKQYDTLQNSLELEVQCGDDITMQQGCKRCSNFIEEISTTREVIVTLENEKSATVAQMKLFEDDFHKVREQLKFNEEKHQREMSDSMKNCQILSQELDKTKDDMQKVRDHNQALEYQLSIHREYRPNYYSVDPHPNVHTDTGHNASTLPWQEGYRTPQLRAVDFADSRHEIEADSAYDELKGVESEEEAELTRR